MDAIEYFKEKERMTQNCKISCLSCPLFKENNKEHISCYFLAVKFPEQAIKIVEDWSKAHPQKTQADLFFERYPNAMKDKNGFPSLCPDRVFIKASDFERYQMECEGVYCDTCRKKYWSELIENE